MELSLRSHVFTHLYERSDQIKSKKTLNLDDVTRENTSFTSEIIDYSIEYISTYFPGLEIERVTLSNNQIKGIPSNLYSLSNTLKYLDLHNNDISILPGELASFQNLEILDASSNKLKNLPPNLSSLNKLSVLSLKNNKIQYLHPVLAGMRSLSLLELNGNPLILPPMDLVKSFQKQSSEIDWVKELKAYLTANSSLLQHRLTEMAKHVPTSSQPLHSQPSLARSRSVSDSKSKASRAARRMGLIIKKPEDSGEKQEIHFDPIRVNNMEGSHSSDQPLSAPSVESSSRNDSPLSSVSEGQNSLAPNDFHTSSPSTPGTHPSSGPSGFSRPPSRSRSRSNTLKEIDRFLEKNGNVDTEHKSSAYFRRLSTLPELPTSGLNISKSSSSSQSVQPSRQNSQSGGSWNGGSSQAPRKESGEEEPPSFRLAPKSIPSEQNELSPMKANTKYDATTVIKISRKVLFAFSELHSSIRRFTGFCIDKKVTIKMVSYLYSTKSNIDSLVEELEMFEDNNSTTQRIVKFLHACISSFQNIMNLLTESFSTFVKKTDVCFVRMLYITLFGSLNEIFNAYKLLKSSNTQQTVSATQISKVPLSTTNSSGNQETKKLTVNTKQAVDSEDVDEKLYNSIDNATTDAQTVFAELTSAIGKSAIASATTNSEQQINHSVAIKVKELTNVCVSSMDITKKLKTELVTIRNNPSQTTKKLFWDDINLFLKSVIQTFSAVKNIMKDLPVLNEVRGSMANLTKATKEVTILLEISSYKMISSDASSVGLSSVSSMFTPLSSHPHSQSQVIVGQATGNQAPVRTPLFATVGPAAQAIMPTPSFEASGGISFPLSSPSLAAPTTAPAHSVGQSYAKSGMNPFDTLIAENVDREKENNNYIK